MRDECLENDQVEFSAVESCESIRAFARTPSDKPQVRFHVLDGGETDVVQCRIDEVDLDEIRIIGPICIQFVRSADRVTRLASDRRNAVDQRNQLGDITAIRTGQRVSFRRSSPVFPPPPTARIDALSTVA
jgi:hypothetical protein